MNEDIVVMDAQTAESTGKYDINEQIIRLYEFNLDETARELELPAMSKRHRGVIFDLTKKYALDYVSKKKKLEDPDALVPVTVKKCRNYVAKVWPSPFGPEESTERKKKNYDKIPTGLSCIIADFLFLGSGRDADAIEQLKRDKITAVLNVTAEWKENPAFREHGIKFRRIVIKDFVTGTFSSYSARDCLIYPGLVC